MIGPLAGATPLAGVVAGVAPPAVPAAIARDDIADYVNAVFLVYIALIFTYIIVNWLFAAGMRPPYSRPLNAVLTFLRDVVEPFLRIFRRFIPMMGPLDLSPIVALIVLYIVQSIIVRLIAG